MRFFKWTLGLFLIWTGLTSKFDIADLSVGLVISALISLLTIFVIKKDQGTTFHIYSIVKYLYVLMINLIKSNVDLARRIVHPKLPINPGIVKISTTASNDTKRLLIANSITLTPGTVTIDMTDDCFYVHWIDVTTRDMVEAGDIIKGDFEKIIA